MQSKDTKKAILGEIQDHFVVYFNGIVMFKVPYRRLLLRTELTEKVHEYLEVHKSHNRNGRFDIGIQFNQNLQQYHTLGRIMTGHSIRKLRIFVVPIMLGNYNHGVIHDEVKNTAVYSIRQLVS